MNGESRKPFFPEPLHSDLRTVSEIADDSITDIFIQAQTGVISWVEAKGRMDEIEAMRTGAGDSWFDRYGRLSPELEDLFEGDQR